MNRPGAWRRLLGRVPMRQQLTRTECAAACLAMVASYHGRTTSVTECRELLGSGRDGVTARRLLEAAGELGLQPAVTAAAPRPGDRGPGIAYLAEHHFVVVEKVGPRGVRLVDPASGRQWEKRDGFAARFGGLRVDLVPGPRFVPRRRPFADLLAVRYVRQFVMVPGGRRLLAVVVLFAAALKLLGLALPILTQKAVDSLVPHGRADLLPHLAAVIAGTVALVGLTSLARALMLVTLRARADTALSTRFLRHVLRLPLPYFLQRTRGDLLMRLGSMSGTRDLATQQVLILVLDTALLVGYLVGLAVVAPGYVPLVVVLAGVQAAVLARAYPRLGVLAQRELTARTAEQSYVVEVLNAITSVKAGGAERRAEARWDSLFRTYLVETVRRSRASARVDAIYQALTALAPLALLWLGLSLVLDGRMTLGTALAANTVAMSVLTPVHTLATAGQLLPMLRSQIERMYDVLDAAEEPTGRQAPRTDRSAAIEVRDLAYRYHADAEPVLTGIGFTVPAGSKVAVVGPTGSGKSTLALLLLGLLRPDRGTVRHDGVAVDDIDLHALRAGFGVVLQDLNLFQGTVRENITLNRPDASDDDVHDATATAGLHHDVQRLAMGYHTQVGEGGAALSAGQRQRVALARALLNRPRLLVLDEATSHLDPLTERRVDAALSALAVTRIVISHRLSAVRNADLILVLHHGRIVARGRHEDLVTRTGTYRDLFADAADEAAPTPQPTGSLHA